MGNTHVEGGTFWGLCTQLSPLVEVHTFLFGLLHILFRYERNHVWTQIKIFNVHTFVFTSFCWYGGVPVGFDCCNICRWSCHFTMVEDEVSSYCDPHSVWILLLGPVIVVYFYRYISFVNALLHIGAASVFIMPLYSRYVCDLGSYTAFNNSIFFSLSMIVFNWLAGCSSRTGYMPSGVLLTAYILEWFVLLQWFQKSYFFHNL